MTQDVMFTPLSFRNLTVKNRIFRSSITGRWDNYDGSGTQARVNWETSFAAGGVGCIISAYCPISIEGRIAPNTAMIEDDKRIPFWETVGQAVHAHDCKFILQLSHSGRQRDIEGVENTQPSTFWPQAGLSSTSQPEQINGFKCQSMTEAEIEAVVRKFADAAERAQKAGLDGIELHSSHGYLFSQFLSSGINDRRDRYGGSLENRYRFLRSVVQAVRDRVGPDFHFQAKISAIDFNNLLPWEKPGNRLQESIQVCQWLERDGIDAIHVSRGSTFPHPLLPAGKFPFQILSATYDGLLSGSRCRTLLNYVLFRFPVLRPLFSLIWNHLERDNPWTSPLQGNPVRSDDLDTLFREHIDRAEVQQLLERYQGTVIEDAQAIKQAVTIPVICTGGFQQASFIRQTLAQGFCDGVSLARPLIANRTLVQQFAQGQDLPEKPCTYCNQCIGSYLEYPLGCYELARFYEQSIVGRDAAAQRQAAMVAHQHLIETAMAVYDPPPQPYCPPLAAV